MKQNELLGQFCTVSFDDILQSEGVYPKANQDYFMGFSHPLPLNFQDYFWDTIV